jgi:hypothetical protein
LGPSAGRRRAGPSPARRPQRRSSGVAAAVHVAGAPLSGVEATRAKALNPREQARAELQHRGVGSPAGARRSLAADLGAQRRAEGRHQQRRGHALAGDVGHDQAEPVGVERHVVVVVAADRVRWQVHGGDVVAREARRPSGQEPSLHVARDAQLVLEPLLLQHLAVEQGLLDRERGSRNCKSSVSLGRPRARRSTFRQPIAALLAHAASRSDRRPED